jgi:hypothetical protein
MQACQLEQATDIHEEEGKWGRLLLIDAQIKEMSEISELHPSICCFVNKKVRHQDQALIYRCFL